MDMFIVSGIVFLEKVDDIEKESIEELAKIYDNNKL